MIDLFFAANDVCLIYFPNRFLFERDDLRILYTGDFRLENRKLPTLTGLHNSSGEPLKIDQMYLDTTFCSKEYEKFPPRTEAIEAIWELVRGWIHKNGDELEKSEKYCKDSFFLSVARLACNASRDCFFFVCILVAL